DDIIRIYFPGAGVFDIHQLSAGNVKGHLVYVIPNPIVIYLTAFGILVLFFAEIWLILRRRKKNKQQIALLFSSSAAVPSAGSAGTGDPLGTGDSVGISDEELAVIDALNRAYDEMFDTDK
ncbi:MAG: hypothetical protein FWE80_08005, partial [Oscillospiraceae bacterium]|nr:hypothetical protein [Oscillospiraceae bacterium]